jgi:hypothetical protein
VNCGLRISDCGLKRVAAGPPGLRLPPRACTERLYKQPQSGAPSREEGCRYEQTKPMCPAVPGSVVQTNPIWGGPGGVRRAILPNKANSASRPGCRRRKVQNKAKLGCPGVSGGRSGGALAGADCAKQSQFGEAGPAEPPGAIMQNKANSRTGGTGRRPARVPVQVAGPSCTNKPNLPPGRREEAPGRGRKCCRGRTRACKTKPICAPGRHDGSGICHRMPAVPGVHPSAGCRLRRPVVSAIRTASFGVWMALMKIAL